MFAQMRCEKGWLCNCAQDSNLADPEFDALLHYLKHGQGCDLTGYKRSILMRQFQQRMQRLQIPGYQSYLEYLQAEPNEYLTLLNNVLINFSSFFRDRDAWNYLATDIIPQIIASKPANQPIRVWSAGCAAGQEIYSLLILLTEALGVEACLQRVRCFATDIDKVGLRQARQASYSRREANSIPADWLQRYFQLTENAGETGYVFHSKLRHRIVFARHNLAIDPPLPKIDLLLCRNVLIYLNSETQVSTLGRFHFALNRPGFLFLGKAETLHKRKQLFTPVSVQQRIYTKADFDQSPKLNMGCDRASQRINLSSDQEGSPSAGVGVD